MQVLECTAYSKQFMSSVQRDRNFSRWQ